jgi:hypothetical protein
MDRIEAAVQRQERRLRALEAGAASARGAEATARGGGRDVLMKDA